MDKLRVGDSECHFTMVISAMSKSHGFSLINEKWTSLAMELGLHFCEIREIQRDMLLEDFSSTDTMLFILTSWRQQQGGNATLDKFVAALEKCSLNDLAAKVREYFKTEEPPLQVLSASKPNAQADSSMADDGIADIPTLELERLNIRLDDWDVRTFKPNDTSAFLVKPSIKEDKSKKGPKRKKKPVVSKLSENDTSPLSHFRPKSINGYALILNIIKYETEGYREGAQYDSQILNQLLTQLGYEVTIYGDPNVLYAAEDIDKIIAEFRNRVIRKIQTKKSPKSIIVYIGCHGINNRIEPSTGSGFQSRMNYNKRVVNQFNSKNCPSLRDIPKIFFAQFCREVKAENVKDEVAEDIENAVVCYAANRGNLAYREPDEGSYFVKVLAKQFSRNAHNTHLIELLDMTCEALKNEKIWCDGKRVCQESDYVAYLQKDVYFNV